MENEKEARNPHIIHEVEESGRVMVDDDVIAVIAALAAADVEGVASLGDNYKRDKIARLGRGALKKCVKVEVKEETVKVYLGINICFGCSIPKVTKTVQEHVADAIEIMTGYKTSRVNIRIFGVSMKEDE